MSAVTSVCLCRVKELGPGGPVEGKPADVAVPSNVPLGTMSPQNSDLAMLKTSNVSSFYTSSQVIDKLAQSHSWFSFVG